MSQDVAPAIGQAEPANQPAAQASGLEYPVLIPVPSEPDWKKWFDLQVPGIDSVERDYLLSTAAEPDGGYELSIVLPSRYSPTDGTGAGNFRQRAWEIIGIWFMNQGRFHDAIEIFQSLYTHMLRFESDAGRWTHKGMPLVWLSECFFHLHFPVHAKRYLMYTLCEDAICYGPEKRAQGSGVYFRARRGYGMSDHLVSEYTRIAYDKAQKLGRDGWFPERLLAELDDRWMSESPTGMEFSSYVANSIYIRYLMSHLGKTRGMTLEWLAHYLVSMIPGCRAYRRELAKTTDFDVLGSFEGPATDFRSELGRYFLCECKDWNAPADFTTMAKLARLLDSVRSRFGILFSKNGISRGEGNRYAEREQLKVFAQHGIAIIVISEPDLEAIANGESFLSMLRSEYEFVRLDLSKPLSTTCQNSQPRSAKLRSGAKGAGRTRKKSTK